jgi:cobalt-precorrin-5B (C1)-methyltransferase
LGIRGQGLVKKEKHRSGYTTGACAAAAAKAAAMLLFSAEERRRERVKDVEIPFPDGSRVEFKIHKSKLITHNSELTARASVIKDAGDDPDVTNGAEIVAEAKLQGSGVMGHGSEKTRIIISGGEGVGTVTKPGLPVPIGEPAINPVPRKMIEEAVMESVEAWKRESVKVKNLRASELTRLHALEITISVPNGEEIAKKTLNHRLGIVGGISILGTTGIVKPVSTEAWTATIASSMDVAKAMGHKEIVVSAGRSSEKAHMKRLNLPEEVYVLMGDHLEYSLKEAWRHGFKKIHLCAQWAKMVKIAMATPQTHVRFGAIDIKKAVDFLQNLGLEFRVISYEFNTAREIFDLISASAQPLTPNPFIIVCNAAKNYAEGIAGGIPVTAYLVSYEGEIIASSE